MIKRLNHAVLYVSDLARSLAFYKEAFEFEEISRLGAQAVFLRAAGSDNHHDLALFSVGADAARPSRGSVGLYHLAWEVESVDALSEMSERLASMNALGGMSDHGATLSLYGADPDGIEFEVMWMLPREAWGEFERDAVVRPLDLEKARARFSGAAPSR
jgi:catechol-2,3-dioxygenase